jgi:hypothetical protein
MLSAICFACLASCEDMNSLHQDYLDRGESIYTAKVDSIESIPGLNKVWFKWWLKSDPRITKIEIRWNEDVTTKTQEYILDREKNDSLIMETVIDNLPEGSLSFEFITWDNKGNRSLSMIKSVEVPGDKYKASLRNRPIYIATKFGNGYALVWNTSNCMYSDLSYKTVAGENVSIRLPADNENETPRMYLYDFDGVSLTQTTYYLYKTPVFVDTIVVAPEVHTGFNDVSVTLTSSAVVIAGPGHFDLGGEGVGFHDSNSSHDPGSNGANYRPNLGDFESAAMDIEGAGGNIGYTNNGEWLMYTVDVRDEGDYEIDWYISVNGSGAACHLEVDDKVFDTYPMVSNGHWSNWRYYCELNGVAPPVHYFTRGKHKVKFVWNSGGFNFNGLRFKKH